MRNHDAKRLFRKYPDELPSTASFLYNGLAPNIQKSLGHQAFSTKGDDDQKYTKFNSRAKRISWRGMRPTRTHLVLILSWIVVLWWGERTIFSRSIATCTWETWEQWSHEASPHHAILVADPQLIDPHTYPGRPWPISSLTTYYTDLYLRRSFSKLQTLLDPDTVYFLGDLFDGGREWATGKSQSPDKQWKKYGGQFWLQEYDRFGRIFLDGWNRRDARKGKFGQHRKIIASLPGNHDLGLGNGIRLSVRDRFNAYFGSGNRVDVVANHTFVSVDTVSLSAKGQPTVDTPIEDNGPANIAIWGSTDEFLSQVKDEKARALDRELRIITGKAENLEDHRVLDLDDPLLRSTKQVSNMSSGLPSILLTHVPLYRAAGTPCGPFRERWPPSKARGSEDVSERDDQNAIQVSAGHQYQNVLQPSISNDLIDRIGNVEYVFSGDDHDYCEVLHRGYTSRGGGVREITVKSISWAMGVRRPGFLMLSLWNPIDEAGRALNSELREKGTINEGASISTLQSHLCLLPDQLGIFIRYGFMLGLMIMTLIIRATYRVFSYARLLDCNERQSSNVKGSIDDFERHPISGVSSLTLPNEQSLNGLASRSTANRARSMSPVDDYGIPITKKVDANGGTTNGMPKGGTQRRDQMPFDEESLLGTRKRLSAFLLEIAHGNIIIVSVALPWYIWLVWTG